MLNFPKLWYIAENDILFTFFLISPSTTDGLYIIWFIEGRESKPPLSVTVTPLESTFSGHNFSNRFPASEWVAMSIILYDISGIIYIISFCCCGRQVRYHLITITNYLDKTVAT